MKTPLEALRHHVTGAIERGEAVPIVGVPAAPKLTEQEETRRGKLLADMLGIRRSISEPGRYVTDWGTKTELGLYRTIKRIVEEGK